MTRYRSGRPKAWNINDDEPFRPSLTVDEHEQANTGLVTAKGEPIYRLPNPMGFGRDREW